MNNCVSIVSTLAIKWKICWVLQMTENSNFRLRFMKPPTDDPSILLNHPECEWSENTENEQERNMCKSSRQLYYSLLIYSAHKRVLSGTLFNSHQLQIGKPNFICSRPVKFLDKRSEPENSCKNLLMKKCLLCLHFTIIIVRIDNLTRVVYDEVDQRKQKKLLELKTLKPDADFDETFWK